jgi:hypothetical protein
MAFARGDVMAFERLKARLRDIGKNGVVPQGAYAAAARNVKAIYLADSVSARGNTPYTPTDVQCRADSLGITLTAPEWSMEIARREGQPAKWREGVAAVIRASLAKAGA